MSSAILDENEVDEILADDSAENAPAHLPLAGASGPRQYIAPAEARERREFVSALLMAELSTDTIIAACTRPKQPLDGKAPGLGLSEEQTRRLIREVWAMWDREDAEMKPHQRAAAKRRIGTHIRKAIAKGQFAAAAMLEKTLAKIEGTEQPTRVEVSMSIEKRVLAVLAEEDPEVVRSIITRQIAREKKLLSSGREVTDDDDEIEDAEFEEQAAAEAE